MARRAFFCAIAYPAGCNLKLRGASSSRIFLHKTIKSVFPQALVAPYVVVGATDARAYAHLCPEATYRFMPLLMDQADIERLHGTNERIGTATYQDVVRFTSSCCVPTGKHSLVRKNSAYREEAGLSFV